MLTDSKAPGLAESTPRPRAVGAKTNIRWADSQKIEAATTYLVTGNMRMVAHMLKIPEVTLYSWKKTEWWAEIIKEIKGQENLVLSNKLKKIVDKSLELVSDRLENGDFIYDQKAGKLVRKPMAAKDLHKIAVDMIDKQAVLENKESVTIAEENVASKLEKLAQQFEQFANKVEAKPAVEVTDVVFIQEGANEGMQEMPSDEGSESIQDS